MNLNLKFCVSVGTEYIAYFSEGDVDVDKGSGDGGGGGGWGGKMKIQNGGQNGSQVQ